MVAAGAEVGEGEMSGAGEFDSGGDDGGVEVEDGAELNLKTEVEGGSNPSTSSNTTIEDKHLHQNCRHHDAPRVIARQL